MVDIEAIAALWRSHDQQTRCQDVPTKTTRHLNKSPMADFNQALDHSCSRGLLVRSKDKDATFKFSIDIQKYIMEDKPNLLTILKL